MNWNMKTVIATVFIVAAITIIIPLAVSAEPKEGDICTTDYTDPLIGSDGKYFYRSGVQTSIKYNADGSTSTFLHENYDGPRMHSLIVSKSQGSYYGYCIEQGLTFPDARAYSGVGWQTDNYFSSLPSTVKNGIMLATIFGRQPGKTVPVSGCNDDDWYWATQVIIWEYQQKLRLSPTKLQSNGYVPANYFQFTLDGRPAEKCYDYILSSMANHEKVPSFSGASPSNAPLLVLKWDNVSDNWHLSLPDQNQMQETIQTSNQKIKIEKISTEYIFTSTVELSGEVVECKKKIELPSHDLLIWGGDTQTQSIATGTADPISFFLKFRTEQTGTFEILKSSEDGQKLGFLFQIDDQNGYRCVFPTDEDGQILIPLLPGEYVVSEQELDRYRDIQEMKIQIREKETTQVQIENKLKKGKIRIQKTVLNPLNQVNFNEFNGVFQIYSTKYSSFQTAPELYRDQMKTDSSGSAVSKELPLGSYRLHQISSNPNIAFATDEIVVIDDDLQTVTIPLKNQVQQCRIKITKTNPEVNPLPGAVFTIRPSLDILDVDGSVYLQKGELIDTVVTDKDGIACSDWLYPGQYNIEEIIAPKGYLPPQNPITEINLMPENKTSLTFTIDLAIKNQPVDNVPNTGNSFEKPGTATQTSILFIALNGMILFALLLKDNDKTLR